MDWPTFALVGRTFAQAFPRGALFTTLTGVGDYLLVGFKGEVGLDPDTAGRNLVHARESRNMVLPDYRLLYRLIITEDLERLFGPGPLHTDNRPRLEFAAPRQLHTSDASIEENLSQRGTLSARSRAVVRETEGAAARLDLLAFSASVGSPLFNAISPEELSPDHRHRYHRILDAYCSETAVEDYGLIPDSAASARCAEHQAAKIRSHLSRVPRDAAAHYSLGLALQQTGHNREALAAFEKAVSINPFHAPAYNNMGIAHVREADFEKAEAAFLKALSVNPAHANAHFNLARIALQQGEKDKAMARLRQGLQHEENPRARALLRELLLTE
jgi:spermidine synthase